jgi:starch-binding outer membrane protein, SusD/RagB family
MAASKQRGTRGRAGARAAAGLVCASVLTACIDLGVTNPGNISDEALNDPVAVDPIVAGMAGDFATGYDDMAYFMGIASHEITHSGAFLNEQQLDRGEIDGNNTAGRWNDFHRARWVAENGIERMKELLGNQFSSDARSIEAYVWAGFSNRVLGEFMCNAVIDGGPAQPHTVHLERAESWFSEGITLAQNQNQQRWLDVAYAGRAQIRLLRENWGGAASDAARVPDGLLFEAEYSATSVARERNWLANESHVRAYFSVYGTDAADSQDPRMPWTNMNRVAVDGRTPFYRQEKYQDWGANIAIAKGDEMRLIEAEALLRGGDVPGALGKINHVRARAGVTPVTAASEAEAWQRLREERNTVLWMEARHFPDRRRFNDAFLQGRGSCIPISDRERETNPNITG